MFQLATSYLTPAVSHFTTMLEDISCGRGKDVNEFQKDQMIGLHQAKKTTKGIAETTQIRLITVQRIIKTKSMNPDLPYSRVMGT